MNAVKKFLAIMVTLVLISLIVLPIKVFAIQQGVTMLNDSSLVSGAVYYIKNKNSGKYLNVNFGTDANGTNVNQWAFDGSIEQKWKVVQNENGTWKIYAMCSSNGTNRVLDALRTGGSASGTIQHGNNIDIWSPNDSEAQNWILWSPERDGYYYIALASASDPLVVTAYGTLNGSGAGTTSTSAGNVYLSRTTGESSKINSQFWEFIRVN